MKKKQIIEQIKKNIACTQKIFESCQKLSKSIFEVNFRVPAFLKLTISFQLDENNDYNNTCKLKKWVIWLINLL